MRFPDVAALDRAGFINAFRDVFEHSPWVAEAAWEARPFASVDALHAAMMDAVRGAPPADQVAFFNRHPELAGQEARAGTMTGHSTTEQRAGLADLGAGELVELRRLNAAYRARHGFPFVIAVLAHTPAQIFEALRTRIGNATTDEVATTLHQISEITRRRLRRLLSDT